MHSWLLMTLTLCLVSGASWADHGRDFLLVQTSRFGDVGSILGIARQDFVREEGESELAFDPLLSWTVLDWLSLEINADAEKAEVNLSITRQPCRACGFVSRPGSNLCKLDWPFARCYPTKATRSNSRA